MTSKLEQGKKALADAAQNVDKKADELVTDGETILAKLKKSKYTAAALTGAGLLVAFLIIK